jgi:hypothetical protein
MRHVHSCTVFPSVFHGSYDVSLSREINTNVIRDNAHLMLAGCDTAIGEMSCSIAGTSPVLPT